MAVTVATARVTVVGHGKLSADDTHECDILIDGAITESDAANFSPTGSETVCLDSVGGSYDAALKIAEILITTGTSTAIPAKAKCYSACAIIFMAGSAQGEGGLYISRKLSILGRLGFHAPFIEDGGQKVDAVTANRAYRAAITAVGRFLAMVNRSSATPKEWVLPLPLLAEMLSRGPDEFYEITSLREAMQYHIDLTDYEQPRQVSRETACIACFNIIGRPSTLPCRTEHMDSKTDGDTTIFSYRFILSEETQAFCNIIAAHAVVGDHGLILEGGINEKVQAYDSDLNFLYLYGFDRKLMDLPRAKK